LILPILLDELNAAGVADRDISIVVALGTHRRMNRDELTARVGEVICNRVTVGNLSQKPEDFVNLGVTPLGIPIHISRQYLDCDISIAVGNIIPHMYAGWAGGAKMVQPGVTSAVTTGRTHLIAGPRVYEILGEVDNPVRAEMEEIAIRSGLKFIVNVVLGASGEVAAVVAGDVVKAHLHHGTGRKTRRSHRQFPPRRPRFVARLQARQQLRNGGQGRRHANSSDPRARGNRTRSHPTGGFRHR
jgi:nickel-dependent lactate racemase